MDKLLKEVDSFDKFLKVTQVTTQALWTALIEVRTGLKRKQDIEAIYAMLMALIAKGWDEGWPLPELDEWWANEIVEAYSRV